jgi:hypothetical protein
VCFWKYVLNFQIIQLKKRVTIKLAEITLKVLSILTCRWLSGASKICGERWGRVTCMNERFGKSDLQVCCIASLVMDSLLLLFHFFSSFSVRASPVMLSMWRCKKCFSRPTCLLFPNSTYKTQTGTANRWETTNSKSLGQITLTGQSETSASKSDHIYTSSTIIFITLFSGGR